MISIVRVLSLIMSAPLFLGCATGPLFTDISGSIVDPKLVKCQLLGPIKGATMGDSYISSLGLSVDAKKQVLANAKKMGATHILWGMLSNGYTPYTYGDAYRCSNNVKIPKNMVNVKPTI